MSDTEGTWIAGVTGPPAMIMPAHPQVGDVYRTENIPGLVFEQVTVKKVDQTVNGPTGPVHGAMVGQELHMDEKRLEAKTFAPGYGEFFSGGGHTFEATALAVPVDRASGPSPSCSASPYWWCSSGAISISSVCSIRIRLTRPPRAPRARTRGAAGRRLATCNSGGTSSRSSSGCCWC